MRIILTTICAIAIAWRGFVSYGIIYDRIKTRVPSPILNVIFWDSILLLIIAGTLLAKIWK